MCHVKARMMLYSCCGHIPLCRFATFGSSIQQLRDIWSVPIWWRCALWHYTHWSESLCVAVHGFLFWGGYPGRGLLGQMHFQLFKGWPDCFQIGCTILCSLCSHQPRWRGSLCSHQACWRVPFGPTRLLGGVFFVPNQAPWRGPLCSHQACWRGPFLYLCEGWRVSLCD